MAELTWLDRVKAEREELALKAKKLEEFIQSDKFDVVDKQSRIMLPQQLALMVAYDNILLKRIELADNKAKA